MKYTKLPALATFKKYGINISIVDTDIGCVVEANIVDKLWRIMSNSLITKRVELIEQDETVVCYECTPNGSWYECKQPNTWYQITHHPSSTYLEVNSLLFHEIAHHGLLPPPELLNAADNIPDSHLDIVMNYSIKPKSPSTNPSNWPVIHVLPMYYNYGYWCMGPRHLHVDNKVYDASNVNDEDEDEDDHESNTSTNIEVRQQFINKLSNFASMAGTDGCISTMRMPNTHEPKIGKCQDCSYTYDNSILILRDWSRHLCYRLDRASSHAIRQHKAWVPQWFSDFIMHEVV